MFTIFQLNPKKKVEHDMGPLYRFKLVQSRGLARDLALPCGKPPPVIQFTWRGSGLGRIELWGRRGWRDAKR